ncbi:MAG TPA: hypothetical protein VIS52_06610, partial [Motiliproteus sp.]
MLDLRKFNIRTRLVALAGLLVVINLGVVAFTTHHVDNMETLFDEYDAVGVEEKLLTLQISRDMNYVSRLTRSIMLGDDYAKNMSKLNDYVEKIRGHFAALESTAQSSQDPAQRQQLSEMIRSSRADTLAFVEDGQQLMAGLARQSRTPELLQQTWQRYRTQATPLANQARASFKTLLEQIETLTASTRERTSVALSGLQRIMLLVSLGSLLLMVGFTWLIAGSIQRPLQRMRDAIVTIESNNDLSLRLHDGGQDELAE